MKEYKAGFFILSDRRLVLNHSVRIFNSLLIISMRLGKESCEQKAFVSSANKISLSAAEALAIKTVANRGLNLVGHQFL